MDHLEVLRDKIGRLRLEIADVQELNQQFRRDGGNGADVQVAHAQRSERLQAIQHQLVQLADLGRRVVSTEQMKEKHRSRLHLVTRKRASSGLAGLMDKAGPELRAAPTEQRATEKGKALSSR
jgi:hypothetical protein